MRVEHATARRPQCGASATAEGGRGARVSRRARVARAGTSLGGRRRSAGRDRAAARGDRGRAIDRGRRRRRQGRGRGRRAARSRRCSRWSTRPASSCTPTSGARRWPRPRSRAWRRWRAATPTSSIELDARRRGSRHEHVAELLATLTGAEDALVVNNCAAAVLLALSQLASGRDVVVSRGELVEIGGSFRVPDVMRASGARLVEVGTTNRTHARDYADAVDGDTALLLKVHRSNFAIVGFTTEVEPRELAELAHARGCRRWSISARARSPICARSASATREPTVPELMAAGADLVTFSGDKLLGGPQAGILVGRARPHRRHARASALARGAPRQDDAGRARGHARALPRRPRVGDPGARHARHARADARGARAQARRRCARCSAPALDFVPARVRSAVGGGALPTVEPWSWAVAVSAREAGGPSADALDARLRAATPPMVGAHRRRPFAARYENLGG